MTTTTNGQGRALRVEARANVGAATPFTVEPLGASQSRVSIATEMPIRSGLVGWLEREMTGRFLRRVYSAELAQLDSEVRLDAR